MDERDRQFVNNLKAATPFVGTPTLTRRTEMEGLADMLRRIADEMDAEDWIPQEAAVLVTRDEDGYLTFCEWGETGQLLEQATQTKRTTA